MHVALVTKPHLGLGRMNIHVDGFACHLNEKMYFRTPLLDRRNAVGFDYGVSNGAIFHHATIDKNVLWTACGTLLGERRDVAADLDVADIAPDLHQIASLAVQLI